jgi:hypothetical protein
LLPLLARPIQDVNLRLHYSLALVMTLKRRRFQAQTLGNRQ